MLPKWCSAAWPGPAGRLLGLLWSSFSAMGLVGQWHCTSLRSVALDSRQCNALLSSAMRLFIIGGVVGV